MSSWPLQLVSLKFRGGAVWSGLAHCDQMTTGGVNSSLENDFCTFFSFVWRYLAALAAWIFYRRVDRCGAGLCRDRRYCLRYCPIHFLRLFDPVCSFAIGASPARNQALTNGSSMT